MKVRLLPRLGLVVLTLGFALSACSSTSDLPEKEQSKPLRDYEEQFDPSAYRNDVPADSARVSHVPEEDHPKLETWVERVEKVMGYRIQLFSTTDIDAAQKQLPHYSSRLDSLAIHYGRIDLTFDAPYYKIRLGDFLTKAPADSLRTHLQQSGMTEAWVVRDNVMHIVRELK